MHSAHYLVHRAALTPRFLSIHLDSVRTKETCSSQTKTGFFTEPRGSLPQFNLLVKLLLVLEFGGG